ncbi:hypothetical protein MTsPCn5_00130 [Croceitalea sp. MTPC5]|nr:hypothetical protein MTsPCn5_00130 [Croceitalea sp. MTPC5]
MKELYVSLYKVLKEIIVIIGKELWIFIKQ